MTHLSFYWLPDNRTALISSLETEFAGLVSGSISSGKIMLPPIPEVVLKIQKLCTQESTEIADITQCLTEDPALAAVVIRVANSVIFNRRNVTCTAITTAVSRLGILRVRDIVTAQAIEQLKHSVNLSKECKDVLVNSASVSRDLAAVMVLLVNRLIKCKSGHDYQHLEAEKALLVGLLADIGLYCLVSEYHLYLNAGNYLDKEIAMQIFNTNCSETSLQVLQQWGFDEDFLEVASNKQYSNTNKEVSYLEVARLAHYLLLFRSNDSAIEDYDIELNADGADAMFELSNLSDQEFRSQINAIITKSGI
jgi:HD-like signal output (HDOD) protein